MHTAFNANIKVLMGGVFCGYSDWNKTSNDIDHCFKLYYFRKGTAEISAQGKVFTLESPGLYFINGFSIEKQHCLDKMVVEWLHFLPESVYLKHVFRFAPCVSKLRIEDFQSFLQDFKKFKSFFSDRLDSHALRVMSLQIQSLVQLSMSHVLQGMDKLMLEESGNFQRLMPALEFMNRNYTQTLNLEDIAKVCFLSPNYFHRLFSEVFNISPLAYIRQMRLEEAIRQLTYTGKAVKEISYAVGYEDEAYFSRTFSKVYGVSPGKYRKENKQRLP